MSAEAFRAHSYAYISSLEMNVTIVFTVGVMFINLFTIMPSDVHTKQMPSIHITSRPIKFIGQQSDNKNAYLNGAECSSSHLSSEVKHSLTVLPEATKEYTKLPLISGFGVRSSVHVRVCCSTVH